MMYHITIDGKPQPKERPKVYKGHAITPTRTKNYEARIAAEWIERGYPTIEGPVRLDVEFYFPIPQGWSKKKKEQARHHFIVPAVRPDLDNLVKIVQDGLNGVAYADDKQVVMVWSQKLYDDEPRTEVYVQRLSTETE